MCPHGGDYPVTKVRTAGKTQENFQESELLKCRALTALPIRAHLHARCARLRVCLCLYVYPRIEVLRRAVDHRSGRRTAPTVPARRAAARWHYAWRQARANDRSGDTNGT